MINKYICSCKKYDFTKKDYAYWEDRKTTSDEIDIINFIKENFNLNNKYLLHLGIGNSEIASIFSETKKIVGITISNRELQKAKNLNLRNYELYLCDKYSINFYELIKNIKFDLIIDTNLKSYSCCNNSFYYMLSNFLKVLSINGTIITSRKGMSWYKKLKPKLSFNLKKLLHYKLKEIGGDNSNVLTINELENFSKSNNLSLTYNERVLYLSK